MQNLLSHKEFNRFVFFAAILMFPLLASGQQLKIEIISVSSNVNHVENTENHRWNIFVDGTKYCYTADWQGAYTLSINDIKTQTAPLDLSSFEIYFIGWEEQGNCGGNADCEFDCNDRNKAEKSETFYFGGDSNNLNYLGAPNTWTPTKTIIATNTIASQNGDGYMEFKFQLYYTPRINPPTFTMADPDNNAANGVICPDYKVNLESNIILNNYDYEIDWQYNVLAENTITIIDNPAYCSEGCDVDPNNPNAKLPGCCYKPPKIEQLNVVWRNLTLNESGLNYNIPDSKINEMLGVVDGSAIEVRFRYRVRYNGITSGYSQSSNSSVTINPWPPSLPISVINPVCKGGRGQINIQKNDNVNVNALKVSWYKQGADPNSKEETYVGTLPYNSNLSAYQIKDLLAGTYDIEFFYASDGENTITNNTCRYQTSTIITDPTYNNLTANVSIKHASSVSNNNGEIALTSISGGKDNATRQFSISPEEGTTWNNSLKKFTGLSANTTYNVSISEVCEDWLKNDLFIGPKIITGSTQVLKNVSCFGDANGEVKVDITGYARVGQLQYKIKSNAHTYTSNNTTSLIHTFSSVKAGTYEVLVRDKGYGSTVAYQSIMENVAVSQPNELKLLLNSKNDISCFGENQGEIHVSASGGTLSYTYYLNYNSLSNSNGIFNNLPAGDYTVSVTDANGCNGSNFLNVTINTKATLSADITTSNISCYGLDNGSISINNLQGGNGDPVEITLLKKNGNSFSIETSPEITDYNKVVFDQLSPGTYKVEMINLNGTIDCNYFESAEIIITQPNEIIFNNVLVTNETCKDANDGSILPDMQGGNNGFMFYTSNNGNPWTILAPLVPGTYSLKAVKDGCEKEYDSPIYIDEPLQSLDFDWVTDDYDGIYDLQCEDKFTGITIIPSGGWGIYEYSLDNSPFETNNYFEGLTANANYDISIKDYEGCITTKQVVLTAPEPISANFVIDKIECHGDATGAIDIAASGGLGDYEYKIDGGIGSPVSTFKNLLAGDHMIVIDDGECPKSFVVNVPENDQLAINFEVTHIDCFGANNGEISTTISGGVPPYQYNWSTEETEPSISNLSPGIYGLTVTDVKGCQFYDQVEVVQPNAPLTIEINIENVTCNGNNDGKLNIISLGGTEPYEYSIDNGNIYSSSSDWIDLATGIYKVVCRDSHGCTAMQEVEVKEPDILEIYLIDKKDVLCFGNSGTIIVGGNGGNQPYSFSIDEGEFIINNGEFDGIYAGDHLISIKDSKDCISSINVELIQPESPLITDFIITNVTCMEEGNGSITSQIIGGTPPYTFEWDNDIRTTKDIDNLNGGTYTITISDAHDCKYSKALVVEEPEIALNAIYKIQNISCNGLTDGAVLIQGFGGYGVYEYSFNEGPYDSNNLFENLSNGTYSIKIRDAEGCVFTDAIQIEEPEMLSGNLTLVSNVSCFEGSDGAIEMHINGGTPPYSFKLLELDKIQNDPYFANLLIGTYTVEITDTNGCTFLSEAVEVDQPALLTATINDIIDASCGQFNGAANTIVEGGTPPYYYQWIHAQLGIISKKKFPTNLKSGLYDVTISDINNCTVELVQSINDEDGPTAEIIEFTDATCFDRADGKATVVASGGAGNYTYLWSSGEEYPNATQLLGGEQYVEVRDERGCSAIAFVDIGAPEELIINLTSIQNPLCNGSCDGEINIEVTGGEGPYTFNWLQKNDIKGASLTGLCAGSYDIIVTDNIGCQRTESFNLEEPDQVSIEVVEIVEPLCNGFSNGSISVISNGGNGDYTYQWNDALSTSGSKVTDLQAGKYTVYSKDKYGCDAELEIQLNEPNPLRIDLGEDKILCANQSYTLDALYPNGIYKWYKDDILVGHSRTYEVSEGAIYKIDILDDKGCPASDVINIFKIENSLEAEFLGATEVEVGDSLQLVDVSWEMPDSLSWEFGTNYNLIVNNEWSPVIKYSKDGLQHIKLTAYLNGCIDSLEKEFIILKNTGESESGRIAVTKGIKEVSVYPNPTEGKFTINVKLYSEETLVISLYDITGEVIDQQIFEQTDVFIKEYDLLSRKQGVYMVQVVTPSETKLIRVFVR